MKAMLSTLVVIWRIAIPYFRSEDRWAGRVLLAGIVALVLISVAVDVEIHIANTLHPIVERRTFEAILGD